MGKIITTVAALLLTACSGSEQGFDYNGNNNRLIAQRIPFTELANTAVRFTPYLYSNGEIDEINRLITKIHEGLHFAKIALDASNKWGFDSELRTVRTQLRLFRLIIEGETDERKWQ